MQSLLLHQSWRWYTQLVLHKQLRRPMHLPVQQLLMWQISIQCQSRPQRNSR